MTDDEENLLEAVITAAQGGNLKGWDKTFMDDMTERFSEHGSGIRISPKQWTNIKRIGSNLGIPGCED